MTDHVWKELDEPVVGVVRDGKEHRLDKPIRFMCENCRTLVSSPEQARYGTCEEMKVLLVMES